MGKIAALFVVWFVVAIVAPELRPVLVVGAFCCFGGFVVGTQHTAKHTTELHTNRAERVSMRTAEA